MNPTIQYKSSLYQALRNVEFYYLELKYDENDESIHDLRVSIRRLIPLLQIYSNSCSNKKLKTHINKILNTYIHYFKTLGPIRDQQVMIKTLTALQPSSLKELHALENVLLQSRIRLLHVIKSWPIQATTDDLILSLFDTSIMHLPLKKQAKKLLKKTKTNARDTYHSNMKSSKDIHRFRIALKKYRYSLELSNILSIDASKKLKNLKVYQDQLGKFQDISVLKSYLKSTNNTSYIYKEVCILHAKEKALLLQTIEKWNIHF